MKRILLSLVLLASCLGLRGQVTYTDASALPLYGKAAETEGYRRLPASLEGVIREPVWNLGRHSAGLYLRFRTDAPEIHARWSNTGHHMPHMTDCGTGGLDLYAHLDGEWKYIRSGFGKAVANKDYEVRLVGDMQPVMREYMLYLALYDEILSLELGVPEGYALYQPELESPVSEKPVVMYGTSILQGGCASRPGMAHTNILARRLDRTVINLGFSGNAHLDSEIAQLMASVPDPSVFVLDYVPNASESKIEEKGEAFFRILREAHPDVPVIFVEDPHFSHALLDQTRAAEVSVRNAAQRALYERLVAAGEKLLFYVHSFSMTDQEDFVDGVHFTDRGMTHYADLLEPFLREALGEVPGNWKRPR